MPNSGLYRGSVHNVNDPENRGRLQILVPAVLGDAPSGWAEPLLPTTVDTPNWTVGDKVWVMFEGGDPNRPAYFSRMEVRAGDLAPGTVTIGDLDPDLDFIPDGVPPAFSAQPTVTGGLGAFQISNYEIVNPDPVTYEIHVSTSDGFTPDATTLLTETTDSIVTARAMPDGVTKFQYATNYFFRTIAKDADDSAAPSPQAGPYQTFQVTTPDIASDSVTANHIGALEVHADHLQAVLVLSSTIRTAVQGQRTEITSAGVTLYAPNGDILFNLPTVPYDPTDLTPTPATFKGQAEFDTVTVNGGLVIKGVTNAIAEGSSVQLSAGVQPPNTTPTATIDWQHDVFINSDLSDFLPSGQVMVGWARCDVFPLNAFVTQHNDTGSLWWDDAGTWREQVFNTFLPMGIIPHIDGGWLILGRDTSNPSRYYFAVHVKVTTTAANTELVVNGTFASNVTGWGSADLSGTNVLSWDNSANAPNGVGNGSAKVIHNAGATPNSLVLASNNSTSRFPVQGGQTYTITAKIRPGATNPSGRTAYIEAFAYNGLGRNFSGGGVSTAVSVTPGAVTTLTFNWTADVGAESVSLWVWYGGAPMAVGETMYVDDVSMKCASTQKVLNSVANVNLAIPTGAVWDVGFGLQSNLPGAFNLGWVTSDRVPHITRLYMDAVPGHTAWSAVTATYTLAALPVDASGVYNVGTVELANYASAAGMDANFHHVMTLNNKTAYFWTNVAGFARESTYDFPLDTGNASNRLSNWHMNNVQAYIFDDFRSLSKGAGYVTKYSSANFWTATNDGYWYCAHAWWNLTSPYHTVIGPKLRVTMTKRARLKLTSSAFPDGDHSAVGYNAANWPNAVRFYVGKNTSTTPPVNTAMYRQVEATETDQTIVIQSIAFSGNTASSEAGTTTFPLSSGGVIKSAALRADGKPRTNLQGDGNNASLDGLIGPGFILEYPGTTDPPGWMIIDGRSLVRATYPDLFNVIGTTFGLGTDTVGGTTFALPNTKDKFVIGASATLAVGATGGQAGMPSHWHNAVTSDGTLDTNTTGSSHSHTLNFEYAATTTTGGTGIRVTDINSQTGGTGTNAVATTTTGGSTHTHSVIGHTASTGSGATADENRPPFVALNRIIKL